MHTDTKCIIAYALYLGIKWPTKQDNTATNIQEITNNNSTCLTNGTDWPVTGLPV